MKYTLTAADPENDNIWYYIDWGDNSNSGWIGPKDSGESVLLNHTWKQKDTYRLRCKAKDTLGGISDWETFEITMPKCKVHIYPLFQWFLEHLPNVLWSARVGN